MTGHTELAPAVRARAGGRRTGGGLLFLFLIPALVPYVLIVLAPAAQGAGAAFTDWNGISPDVAWVGVDNFVNLFRNPATLKGVTNTLLYASVTTVAENVIGLLLALGINSTIKSRNVLRVAFFMPVVILSVVVAYLWQFMFQSNNGVLTEITQALGLGPGPNWLGDVSVVVFAICIIVTWQFSGYTMVIYLAGLQSVPPELVESAALDGAGAVKRFWYVVRPMLLPALAVNLTLSLIRGFMLFDQVWVTTGGGPAGSSESLATMLFRSAFVFGSLGQASAIALVIALAVGLVGYFQYRTLFRRRATD